MSGVPLNHGAPTESPFRQYLLDLRRAASQDISLIGDPGRGRRLFRVSRMRSPVLVVAYCHMPPTLHPEVDYCPTFGTTRRATPASLPGCVLGQAAGSPHADAQGWIEGESRQSFDRKHQRHC